MKTTKLSILTKATLGKNRITIDISSITPEKQAQIENFFNNSESIITSCEIKKPISEEKTRTYEQLKLWFQIVTDILIWMREPITSENKEAISESLKRYLPDQIITLGGKEHILPKSISDDANISKEDFSYAINRIMEDFRQEGCIFTVDLQERWGKRI